ncbi:MAG: hypothetical protein ACFFDS_10450, partial [Candidatus Thorarchaeota archaeon]
RIAVIDHGKVLTIGSPDELKAKYNSGETIEIQFSKNIEKTLYLSLKAKLRAQFSQFSEENDRIYIKTYSGISDIAEVMDVIEEHESISYLQDIQLRLGTLEDVFLHLTGKKLREGTNGNNNNKEVKK